MTNSTNTHDIKENVRKAYNDIADTYLEWTQSTHEVRLSHLNLLLASLTEGPRKDQNQTVLELGCGAGVPCTQVLASTPNLSVTANDISDSQIALAKSRLPASVTLKQGDMMALEFGAAHFDAVIAMYSIIHLPRDEQTEILSRIWTWLKPGGLFLANFSESRFDGATDGAWLGGEKGEMFWSGWGRDEIKKILIETGFAIEVDEVVVDVEVTDGVSRDVPFHWILAKKGGGNDA